MTLPAPSIVPPTNAKRCHSQSPKITFQNNIFQAQLRKKMQPNEDLKKKCLFETFQLKLDWIYDTCLILPFEWMKTVAGCENEKHRKWNLDIYWYRLLHLHYRCLFHSILNENNSYTDGVMYVAGYVWII